MGKGLGLGFECSVVNQGGGTKPPMIMQMADTEIDNCFLFPHKKEGIKSLNQNQQRVNSFLSDNFEKKIFHSPFGSWNIFFSKLSDKNS